MYETIITAENLHEHLYDDDWLIVDARYDLGDLSAGYYAYKKSHIPNAVYVNLDEDLSGLPLTDHGRHPLPAETELIGLFSRLGIHSEVQVVVYDASFGAIAGRLWWMLRYMGHRAVAVLDGGWQSWTSLDYETGSKENSRQPATFKGCAQKGWLVTLSGLSEVKRLLDSREPARYRGEIEPMDPVAGHIPGAVNHFWKNNLKEDGCFRSRDDLKQAFLRSYGHTKPEDVVFYCGSGVTACHNVLAATHADLPVPGLYLGSWSEWCADSSRAVAVGEE